MSIVPAGVADASDVTVSDVARIRDAMHIAPTVSADEVAAGDASADDVSVVDGSANDKGAADVSADAAASDDVVSVAPASVNAVSVADVISDGASVSCADLFEFVHVGAGSSLDPEN